MLELGHKEKHLMSGIVVQVVVVAFFVFVFTQAVRYLRHELEMYLETKEQLAQARIRIKNEKNIDLEGIKNQIQRLKRRIVTQEGVVEWTQRLELLAAHEFGFRNLKVDLSENPEKQVTVPRTNAAPLELKLYAIRVEGQASPGHVMDFLATFSAASRNILIPLDGAHIETFTPMESSVLVRLKWLVPVTSEGGVKSSSFDLPVVMKGTGTWERRENPFLSPVIGQAAYRVPQEAAGRLRLTSIQWDPFSPTCVINGTLVKLGESVEGYRVVVLTESAALLQRGKEEILLRLPPDWQGRTGRP